MAPVVQEMATTAVLLAVVVHQMVLAEQAQ